MRRKKLDEMDIRELAERLAGDSVVTKVLSKWIENVLRAVYEDEIMPLREALTFIRDKATDRSNPQIAFVADKALKGESLSPLRTAALGETAPVKEG